MNDATTPLQNSSKVNDGYIDAHQHFWKFDEVRDSWIDESMKVIQRDFLPGDLEPILKQNGFAGCIVVQSDQSEKENVFQLEHAEKYPFIKGVVGWVDLQTDNVEERLQYYSQFKKMKGFRHILQGEPQRDLMLTPAFMKGIGLLKKYHFTYDILVFPDQLKYITTFVRSFTEQLFVIDHIAKPGIKEGKMDEWKKDITTVAEHDNVYCKISGLVTEADWNGWKQTDFTPYLDVIVQAFGMNRIMFGSDWPVCLVAATYEETIGIVKEYFAAYSIEDRDKIFRSNAERFYNL